MVYTGSNPAKGFSSSTLHHTLLSLANCFGTFFVCCWKQKTLHTAKITSVYCHMETNVVFVVLQLLPCSALGRVPNDQAVYLLMGPVPNQSGGLDSYPCLNTGSQAGFIPSFSQISGVSNYESVPQQAFATCSHGASSAGTLALVPRGGGVLPPSHFDQPVPFSCVMTPRALGAFVNRASV